MGEGCGDSGIVTVVASTHYCTLVPYFYVLYSLFSLPLLIVTDDGVSVMLVPILSCSGTRIQSRARFLPILS